MHCHPAPLAFGTSFCPTFVQCRQASDKTTLAPKGELRAARPKAAPLAGCLCKWGCGGNRRPLRRPCIEAQREAAETFSWPGSNTVRPGRKGTSTAGLRRRSSEAAVRLRLRPPREPSNRGCAWRISAQVRSWTLLGNVPAAPRPEATARMPHRGDGDWQPASVAAVGCGARS